MDNSSGYSGEQYTTEYLKDKGFEILERNFHSRFGEIDIIARNAEYLVFVEVKTRESGSLVAPFEAVTVTKQRKIMKTALLYLQAKPTSLQPRFDVAGVATRDGVPVSVQYLPNAFDGKGYF